MAVLSPTGLQLTIPEDDVARLMYYLKSITLSCGLDLIQDDLVDYEKYDELSTEREDHVFKAAFVYKPEQMLDSLIFIDEDGSKCDGAMNKFYLVAEARAAGVTVPSRVSVGGRESVVNRVLFFRREWLQKFYIEPLDRNKERLARALMTSQHCTHCRGLEGRCACHHGCPRLNVSECTPRLRVIRSLHCEHCPGLPGTDCSCTHQCPRLPGSRCNVTISSLVDVLREARFQHCEHCKGLEAKCACQEGCEKPPESRCVTVFRSVMCDGACARAPQRTEITGGPRFQCLVCPDYDLCEKCYIREEHDPSHAFVRHDRPGVRPVQLPPRSQVRRYTSGSRASSSRAGPNENLRPPMFYFTLSAQELKDFLRDYGEPHEDDFDLETLRRAAWDCYIESLGSTQLDEYMFKCGIDMSGCHGTVKRRQKAKDSYIVSTAVSESDATSFSGTSAVFYPGQEVQIQGLNSRTDLNGRKGVVRIPNAGNGRTLVLLNDDDLEVRVRFGNLVRVGEGVDVD